MTTIFNCQKQDDSNSSETVQEKRIKFISINEFKNDVVKNNHFDIISQHFDINNLSNKSSKLTKTPDDLILTDDIIKIDKEYGASYTFKLETAIDYNEFYNLIVNVDESGNIEKSQIFEYLPSNEWLTDTTQPFVGHIKISENNIFTNEDVLNSKNTMAKVMGDDCYEAGWEWECAAGNNHPPGTSEDTCPAQGASLIVYVVAVPCGGSGGGGVSFPVGGGPVTGPSGPTNPPTGEDPDTTMTSPLNPDGTPMTVKSIKASLTDILGENDSFAFDDSLSDSETLDFNSVNDFEIYLNALENSFSLDSSELVNAINGTKITKFKGKFALPIPVYLNAHVKTTLDDVLTEDENEFDLIEVTSFESGVTPFLEWEQDSYEHSVNGNIVTIIMYGHFNIGVSIKGFDLSFSESYKATITINNQTGAAINMGVVAD